MYQNLEKMYLVQVKSPHFSISSLSSLLTTSKSFIGDFQVGNNDFKTVNQNCSLTSSLDSSRSSSVTLFSKGTSSRNYHQAHKVKDSIFDDMSLNNFDLDDFMKNANVRSLINIWLKCML